MGKQSSQEDRNFREHPKRDSARNIKHWEFPKKKKTWKDLWRSEVDKNSVAVTRDEVQRHHVSTG